MKEEKLIERMLEHDEEAFEEIYEKYYRLVFLVIMKVVKDKETTKELISDTFLNAYKSLATFDKSRNFSTWLTTIARNVALNYVERKKDKHLVYDEEIVNLAEDVKVKEASSIISVLEGLEYEVVELKIMNNCTYQEISDILNISLSEAYRKYKSGIEKLKKSIRR